MINNIFKLLNIPQKVEYSTRISSIINALVIGWFCLINELSIAVDHIMGYILCDLFVVIINKKEFKDYHEIIYHHISCFLMCCIGYNYLTIYPIECKSLLLMEISTIFSNIRWFMDYHCINGKYYLINGFLFWASFGWFRILTIPYLTQFILNDALLLMIFYLPLTILNIKWFYLITKGLFKFVKKQEYF